MYGIGGRSGSTMALLLLRNGAVGGGVPLGRLVEDHGLGLEERQQPFLAALATDARLLEPAEGHAEVGLEAVVSDGAGPDLTRDLAGAVDVGSEDRGVEAVDGV